MSFIIRKFTRTDKNGYVFSQETHSMLGRILTPVNGGFPRRIFSPGNVSITGNELVEIGTVLIELDKKETK